MAKQEHFIVLDADEAFTANCATGQFLRQLFRAFQPGDQLALHWIQFWRGLEHYRFVVIHKHHATKPMTPGN